MRWRAAVIELVLALAGVVGCQKQCFLTECDYEHYHQAGLPANLECDPAAATIVPEALYVPRPTTVRDTERRIRYLSLAEAIAIALEQGNVGSQNAVTGAGVASDTLASFQGRSVSGTDAIRVLALDPAIVGADIEAALAKFDARWTSSLTWRTQDIPVGSLIDQFQNGNYASLKTSLLKPLPTGGVSGITFNTDYLLVTNPPDQRLPGVPGGNIFTIVNPSYRPRLQFQFEQPLLQNFGIEINQLRTTHPGSLLNPFTTSGRVEGILITRLRFDQQRAEFERNVNYLLLNVETAYWNLYGSYWTFYSREQALRQAFESWRSNEIKYQNGQVPIRDLAQARQQYELFRGQRLTALGDVLERERQLRGLLSLPLEDGCRLVPSDAPTLAPYEPDWDCALNEALTLRPELILARQDLKFRQLELINQKNLLRPDLRFTSTYDINGLGTRLDGNGVIPGFGPPVTSNAFRSFASGDFNSWSLGLNLDIPLGFRDAHASVRVARLNLARSYLSLTDQEEKVQRILGLHYRRIFEYYDLIEAQRAQREAATIQLQQRFEEFQAGRGTLDFLLEAQRSWADALRGEADAIVQYNNALAGFEFAKGTILQHDNVVISEGALPACAQVRAVEHERERTEAKVLRERSLCEGTQPCPAGPAPQGIPALHVSPHQAPPLAVLFPNGATLSEAPKPLPAIPTLSAGDARVQGTPGSPGTPHKE